MDTKGIWDKALKIIADKVTSINFDCWVKTLTVEPFEDGVFTLAAETKGSKEQAMSDRLFPHIETAVKDVAPIVEKVEIIDAIEKEQRTRAASTTVAPAVTPAPREQLVVNASMTFDNFIVGKSNEVVAAAAESVAKNPGKRINPLFIYGNSGLGKTHLLNAIANHIIQESPNARIMLVTSEKFTNDYVYTLKNKEQPTQAFREKYRNVDVLLIDDIQFIFATEKTGTQEEFFHTFNDLFQNSRQIVLASDRYPDEMPFLQERMRSRFKSGLIQDIGSPDVEMRMAILQKKAALENHRLDDDIVQHLATIAVDRNMNIRDMEGMLFKVIFYAGLMNHPQPTMEDCAAAIKETGDEKKIQTTGDTIIGHVCKYFNIKKADITGKKRNREFVEPRMVAIYLICEFLNIPLANIGQILGGRDHTTVMHGRNKIQHQITTDPRMKRIVTDISKMIKSE